MSLIFAKINGCSIHKQQGNGDSDVINYKIGKHFALGRRILYKEYDKGSLWQ
jgi:hypothetical protein